MRQAVRAKIRSDALLVSKKLAPEIAVEGIERVVMARDRCAGRQA
jgi:hypothetical protein